MKSNHGQRTQFRSHFLRWNGRHSAENQIYRIDHYLGKESVQNLMAIRFGNALFEPLWRREWIDNVQITIAEQLGVVERGVFYDRTGAIWHEET